MENLRTIKRTDCAILPLVLKAKWYGMIVHGDKQEEYREYKPYWINRICKFWNNTRDDDIFRASPLPRVVAFSRGYRKADLFFIITGIECRGGANQPIEHPDWGEPDFRHFAIKLGERIQLED